MMNFLRLTFALLCVAVLARAAIIPGEPDCAQYPVPMCPRNSDPLCGTDGKTYANECMLCFDNSENDLNTFISSIGPC